jgi:sialic acid synthase SpsE
LKKVKLGSRLITSIDKPYIIAEIGVNHEGSLDKAKILIDQAKAGGADAAKFQSYKAETIASKDSPSYWDTSKENCKTQYELFSKYDVFEPDDYIELSKYCEEKDIDFISTPFDDFAIDFLDPIVPFFKIASADLTNIPFLRKVADKNKPIILSTGGSNLSEINNAVETLEASGCTDLVLLHCILNYPTENKNAHLRMINGLQKTYPNHIIGYSDHTLPDDDMTSLITAWILGALVIEKHFTNDKSLPGNDHYHAMDQTDLKRFVTMVDQINILFGTKLDKTNIPTEDISRVNARRSLVLTKDIKAGQILTKDDLTYKRPGTGISPIHWDDIVGCRTLTDLKTDQLIQWENLEIKDS